MRALNKPDLCTRDYLQRTHDFHSPTEGIFHNRLLTSALIIQMTVFCILLLFDGENRKKKKKQANSPINRAARLPSSESPLYIKVNNGVFGSSQPAGRHFSTCCDCYGYLFPSRRGCRRLIVLQGFFVFFFSLVKHHQEILYVYLRQREKHLTTTAGVTEQRFVYFKGSAVLDEGAGSLWWRI